ncbi:MAG: RCC1 domain-containing protein [Hyphomicrobiaceae bacterium]
MSVYSFSVFLLFLLISPVARADSSSPTLAAYYDRQMAIVAGKVYAWKRRDAPVLVPLAGRQVGVGRDRYYVLTNNGELIAFDAVAGPHAMLMNGVARFAAGHSGVLAIRNDQTLWWLAGGTKKHLADGAVTAAVGDGANYYITQSGDLFVKGLAHRGQYGDGRLKPTQHFIKTASAAADITAHTGHAIMLKANGDVFGTGGNIYGPVGKHGLGDKAIRWSRIMSGAKAIATGSSHSFAIRRDDTLVAWGSDYGIMPTPVLRDVVAVAAGSRTAIALKSDNTLWQWNRAQKPVPILKRVGK